MRIFVNDVLRVVHDIGPRQGDLANVGGPACIPTQRVVPGLRLMGLTGGGE
jgi:hypothetical protein